MKVPEPPPEVKNELPGGRDKIKDSRGTLAYWVLRGMFALTVLTSGGYIAALKSQISDLKVELVKAEASKDAAIERLIQKLEGATQKANVVEDKIDTVAAVIDKTKSKIDQSLKIVKNEVQK